MPHYRVRDKSIVSEIIDEEAIVMDLATGAYFSSSGAGALIWNGVTRGFEAEQIKQRVQEAFSVEPAALDADFEAFVASLLANKLVDFSPGASISGADWGAPLPAERRGYEAPVLNRYDDLQELALLDPIHDVEDTGWPNRKTNF